MTPRGLVAAAVAAVLIPAPSTSSEVGLTYGTVCPGLVPWQGQPPNVVPSQLAGDLGAGLLTDDKTTREAPAGNGPLQQTPAIHGFFRLSFKTAYITPRGLVVANEGLVIQPVGGLVLPLTDPLTLVLGVWNSINTHQKDEAVGPWNEMDPFITLGYRLNKETELSVTYVPFLSPPNLFRTEHNLEVALKRTGIDIAPGLTLDPYAKFFWAVAGDSTVVVGRSGGTYDVELGVVPTWTLSPGTRHSVTLTLPTLLTVGPRHFWGGDQRLGVFSTALSASYPLKSIPERLGYWSLDASLSYHRLINDNLVAAAERLGTGNERNRWGGLVGIGFGF